MTFEISVGTDVAAPAERVWDAVTDWQGQAGWIPATVVHVLSGSGHEVGSRLLAFTGVSDIGFADTMEITVWDPPRLCRVRHTGKLLRGTGDFAVEPRGPERSLFIWSERLDPPFGMIGSAGLTVLAPAVRLGLRRAVRSLARQVAVR